MRYYVKIGDHVHEVAVIGGEVTLDGRVVAVDLRAVPGSPICSLLIDGTSWTIDARPGADAGQWLLHCGGIAVHAEVVDERTRTIREMTGATAGPRGPRPVRAPMPGLVVRLEVEPGQPVHAGQGVAIIEAMKMENELKADGDGIVARVRVSAGDAVEKGAILVEFEAPE